MSHVVELKVGQFAGFVGKGSSVVLFTASWCKPCQEMKPVFNALAEKLHASVGFGRIDVATYPKMSQKYGVRSIPSLAVFHEGRLRSILTGSRSVSALKKAIVSELKGSF